METNPIPPSVWIPAVAERLLERWPTIDPQRLEDLAQDLWRNERLRVMEPREAAEEWLRPVLTGHRLPEGDAQAASRCS